MTLLVDIRQHSEPFNPIHIEKNLKLDSEHDLELVHFVMTQYLKGLETFNNHPYLVNRFTMRAGVNRSSLMVAHQVSVRDTQVDVYRAYVHYSQDLSLQLRRSHGLSDSTRTSLRVAIEGQRELRFLNPQLDVFATLSLSDYFHAFSDSRYRFDSHTDGTLLVSCGLPMNPLSCSISIPSRAKVLDTLEALGHTL